MSYEFAALDFQMALVSNRTEDFGVREERYRMNMGKKIRTMVREMNNSSSKWSICDQMKCRNFLSRIKRKIDERHGA
ncbi:hypothetical protein KMI_09g14380 [Encephalitozoon hellem]|uniref:Uncharacterized protein n=1 Tax=Encephalitozoon hellem TaxID=27973 RepID=A0A9Q9CEF7_ENCHE|nr:uncharacterized protein EHEL_110945 [Encephalitozoon hellem ATCC 50504]AHL28978.1 hypothetical protein EHEL_110945 [Encephalitozoon hellem ATCC 50504]KAG5859011.1 hypothetical protein KMI_09g14380 [Encephalitozoon hellem]UTX44374.1 hypothetical protein GPU96_11g21760 [Encephalitozoon hellem]WEL39875.1 hypothetical protein PFJ87_11g01120 [Encephalitozoon hellem]